MCSSPKRSIRYWIQTGIGADHGVDPPWRFDHL